MSSVVSYDSYAYIYFINLKCSNLYKMLVGTYLLLSFSSRDLHYMDIIHFYEKKLLSQSYNLYNMCNLYILFCDVKKVW